MCEDAFCDTCFPTRHTRGKMCEHKWAPMVEMCSCCNEFAAQVRSLSSAPGGSGDGKLYCRVCYADRFPDPNPATGLDRMSATQAVEVGSGGAADYEVLPLYTHSMRRWEEEEDDRLERDRVKEEIRLAQLAFIERDRHRRATHIERVFRGYHVRFMRQSEIERPSPSSTTGSAPSALATPASGSAPTGSPVSDPRSRSDPARARALVFRFFLAPLLKLKSSKQLAAGRGARRGEETLLGPTIPEAQRTIKAWR